ncbi:plasminogen-like [Ruditapes philippinarum]|uniref:plasminogen-like n=1 Tax=Ruditapes philippinarum TaxID=129788 RepID=UPI00295BC6A5|nr:plasminogen-like [Ruditapes philippinarum]
MEKFCERLSDIIFQIEEESRKLGRPPDDISQCDRLSDIIFEIEEESRKIGRPQDDICQYDRLSDIFFEIEEESRKIGRPPDNISQCARLTDIYFEIENDSLKIGRPSGNISPCDRLSEIIFEIEEESRKIGRPPNDISQLCNDEINKCLSFQRIYKKSWMDAAEICRSQGTSLVTIKSVKEFNFLHHLLLALFRKRVYFEGHKSLLYIGLSRYIDTSGISHEHWIDGTPLTFTAWNSNQPSETMIKQCTKMVLPVNEQNKTNIWETTTCTEKSGAYMELVCEQKTKQYTQNNTEFDTGCYSGTASKYKGNQSISRSGLRCQRWDSQIPNEHEFLNRRKFPDKRISDAANYCRSPDKDVKPWCFVNDSMIAWDYCPLERCQTESTDLAKDDTTLFKCSSGEWMSFKVRCNGAPECLDVSDEDNCTTLRL